jgi:hypothetical protein
VRREPNLTFEGALRILGRHESRLIGKLDSVPGGVILTAGAGVAAAAWAEMDVRGVSRLGLIFR